MHPIGSWLVSWAIDEAPDLDFDFVNLPAMPDGVADLGLFDADGDLFVTGRVDDMIISGGENVSPVEIESCLSLHPAVSECGVVGVDDEERGQIVMAYVVLKPGHEGNADMVENLQHFVKQHIAPFKYPRRIQFLPAMPRTETGKLQRFRLRQMATNA